MIFLPVIAVLAACWHSFLALHQLWTDWDSKGNTHGYLIAAICLWLLWRERKACAAAARPFSWWRIWPLAAVMSCWLFAVMAGIQAAELLLLPLLFWCAVGAGLGWLAARRVAFPIGYFLFAIPVWGLINGLFQWSSIYAVRAALRVVGIPAYFEANRVQIPEGTFEIAGGCSGLHFVLVGAAIAALLGELRRDGFVRRIKLLSLAVALAMLTNWVRVFIIIMAGHLTHMQNYLVARSHYGFGWVVFGVAMAVFLWLESRLPASTRSTSPAAAVSTQWPAAAADWRGVVLAVVPVLGFFVVWHVLAVRPASGELEVPATGHGWSVQQGVPATWQPVVDGVDESRQLLYRRDDGAVVDVYTGLYRWQTEGKEFSAYGNDLSPSADMLDSNAELIAGIPFTVQRFRGPAGHEHLVAATYRVEQSVFAQPVRAQLWYALRAMWQLRSPASRVLLLHTVCRPDCAAALKVLREWKDGS